MSFAKKSIQQIWGKLLDTAAKAGLDAVKTASKKLIRKPAEETDELIGNKITEKIVKSKPVLDVNSKNAEEIVIPSEKR